MLRPPVRVPAEPRASARERLVSSNRAGARDEGSSSPRRVPVAIRAAALVFAAWGAGACGGLTIPSGDLGNLDAGLGADAGGDPHADVPIDASRADTDATLRVRDSGPTPLGPYDAQVTRPADGGCSVGATRCRAAVAPGAALSTDVCAADGTWQPSDVCFQPLSDCVQQDESTAYCTCTGTTCGNQCADLQTDRFHCGSCSPCPYAQVCRSGVCQCGATHDVQCGQATVDVNSDNANCGGCGDVCNGSCQCGRCQVTLAQGLTWPAFLAVDGTSVYWTDEQDGTVSKVPVGGGAVKILATGQDRPSGIAVDTTRVYWTAPGWGGIGTNQPPPATGTVMSVALAGGSPATIASSQTSPGAIAVDARNVYWAVYGASGALMAAPLAGGAPVTLGTGEYTSAVVATPSGVYWNDYTTIMRSTPGAGPNVALATNTFLPTSIAADGPYLYWTGGGTYPLMGLPFDGGAPSALAPSGGALAVDGTSVYFTGVTGDGDNALQKMPSGGGAATPIAWGSYPSSLAVDATSVYWIDYSQKAIVKIQK